MIILLLFLYINNINKMLIIYIMDLINLFVINREMINICYHFFDIVLVLRNLLFFYIFIIEINFHI